MATSVRLDNKFVQEVKIRAEASHRSLPKQIEYAGKIGQIAMDTPHISFAFIEEALLAQAELENGAVKPWKRRTKRKYRLSIPPRQAHCLFPYVAKSVKKS